MSPTSQPPTGPRMPPVGESPLGSTAAAERALHAEVRASAQLLVGAFAVVGGIAALVLAVLTLLGSP